MPWSTTLRAPRVCRDRSGHRHANECVATLLARHRGTAVTQGRRGDEDDRTRDESDLIHGILLGVRAAARRGSPSDYA